MEWQHNQDGKRPSKITVNPPSKWSQGCFLKKWTADAEGNWLYQFDNLDVVDDGM